jgi:signal transduction histidine kinase
MLKTIRGKITIGVVITSLSVLVIINIIIWGIFEKNLQTFIKNDMEKIRTITFSEMKTQYLISNDTTSFNNKSELWPILNNINKQYDIYASVNDDRNNYKQFTGKLLEEKYTEKIIKDSDKKSSLLYIHNEKPVFYATYAYPMYVGDNYVGTLVFQKDYLSEYKGSINLMTKIVFIQSLLFIAMILIIYFWLKKTTKSLNTLATGMTFVGQGDFSTRLETKSSDEVASLIHHFNRMQDQIEAQMECLQLEKKKIEQLEKSSRNFFNYATHEMKTPVTAIIGYTQLLQKGEMDKEVTERAHNRIIAESKRMHTMVQNMLVVARGKERQRYPAQNFNIKELLTQIIYEFELMFEKQKIDINLNSNDAVIFAVKEDIRTILVNLIDNGIKYSEDGRINIQCKCENNVYIIIENKCLPIPKEIKENLLEPFTKYNYGDHTQVSSGLGLFICKELAKKNNAYITYKVDEGKICFMIELPLE